LTERRQMAYYKWRAERRTTIGCGLAAIGLTRRKQRI
jgi:hypothetical protein